MGGINQIIIFYSNINRMTDQQKRIWTRNNIRHLASIAEECRCGGCRGAGPGRGRQPGARGALAGGGNLGALARAAAAPHPASSHITSTYIRRE